MDFTFSLFVETYSISKCGHFSTSVNAIGVLKAYAHIFGLKVILVFTVFTPKTLKYDRI